MLVQAILTVFSRAEAIILLRQAVDAASSVTNPPSTSDLQGVVGRGEVVLWGRWVVTRRWGGVG